MSIETYSPSIHEISHPVEESSVRQVGLKTRLLLGGQYLHPDTEVDVSSERANFEEVDFSPYYEVSTFERQDVLRTRGSWAEEFSDRFGGYQDFFRNTDVGRRRTQLYSQLGIDTSTFSRQDALSFYDEYLRDAAGMAKFVEDVSRGISEYSDGEDFDSFFEDVKWVASIFGGRSSLVLAHLSEGGALLRDSSHTEIFDREMDSANYLSDEERDLLSFVWEHSSLPDKDIFIDTPDLVEESEPLIDEVVAESSSELIEEDTQGAEYIRQVENLVDYNTGLPTGEEVDLVPRFSRLVERVEQMLDDDSPLLRSGPHHLVLSDEATLILGRIASEANLRDVELAFHVMGAVASRGGKKVLVGAYAAPCMNYAKAERTVSRTDPDFALPVLQRLARNTNMRSYFLEHGLTPWGETTCIGHIHQDQLGARFRANPSRVDFANFERDVSVRPHEDRYWGVFTKSDDKLHSSLYRTFNDNGTPRHLLLPLLFESHLP